MKKQEIKKHNCSILTKYSGHGEAIDFCMEAKNGSLWVGNGEYMSQVNYCPYCGYKSKVDAFAPEDYFDRKVEVEF